MTDETTGRVDLEKGKQHLAEARERFQREPASRKVTLRAVAKLIENVHLEGRVGRFRLEADEPAIRGGTDLGPTPLQYFLIGAAF